MAQLIFKVPDKTTPGYLRRVKKALEFAELINKDMTPGSMDKVVDFLADYVLEPAHREDRVEMLLDATEEQIQQLLGALSGGGASAVPPESEGM